ncbi:hypothetical protein V4R08_11175 [Nitrobacter sp. NHB1]|uniref:hypothetical protein n=1 Tax=Nitrobacter sp. NHB1 TaxID=3119830 RepID=UPI002FFD5C46
MVKTSLLVAAASLLLALPASAADLSFTGEAPQVAPIAQAHMICDDDGNCYRTHARRYVQRWHDDDDDDDDGAVYERRDYRPRYYAPRAGIYRGYGYDGPAFGFSIGTGRW